MARPFTLSLRRKLLLTVNTILGGLLLLLLFLNYRRELAHSIEEQRAELREEAISVYEAVQILREAAGDWNIPVYVDRIASRMHREGFPQHEITVRWGANEFRSQSPENSDYVASNARARQSESTTPFASDNSVVGSFGDHELTIDISESSLPVWTALRRDILLELAGSIGLALIAAAIVNTVLLQAVVQPLDRLVQVVGQVSDGDLSARATPADSQELSILSESLNALIVSLELSTKDRREQMAKARRIQEHLLPKECTLPGLAVAYLFHPADDVAGDYFDVLKMLDDTWLLCIADVMGHGVPAALGAAILKVLLRGGAERHSEPGEILAWINAEFETISLPGDFATVFLARWHPALNALEYASAGHEPGWQSMAAGELIELQSTGLPIGISRDAVWITKKAVFRPGDRLLLVSDGVSETRNAEGELFGHKKMKHIFLECAHLSPQNTLAYFDEQLRSFRGNARVLDDITLTVLQCVEANQPDLNQ